MMSFHYFTTLITLFVSIYITPVHGLFESYEWVEKQALPQPLSDSTATTVGDRIYVIGGCKENIFDEIFGFHMCIAASNGIYIFNPLTGAFEENDLTLYQARYRHTTTAIGNKLYVIGGVLQNGTVPDTVEVLTLNSDGTIAHHEQVNLKHKVNITDMGSFAYNNSVYVTGGYDMDWWMSSNKIFQYNAEMANFTIASFTHVSDRGDHSCVIIKEKVYCYGGYYLNEDNFQYAPRNSMEVLNLLNIENGFSIVSSQSDIGRGDAAVTVIDGNILIFGGETNTPEKPNQSEILSDFEVFSPELGFIPGGELPLSLKRFRFPAAAHGSSVFLFGGQGSLIGTAAGSYYSTLDRVDAYSPGVTDSKGPNFGEMRGKVIELHGGGSKIPAQYLWKTMKMFETQSRAPLRLTYRALGTRIGQMEIVGSSNNFEPLNDFGTGDIPISKDVYSLLESQEKGIVQFPFAVQKISPFHQIPNPNKESLKLPPCVLAKIYQRSITTWNDSEIVEHNPWLEQVSMNITVLYRIDPSMTNFHYSLYLSKLCPDWALWISSTTREWPEENVGVVGGQEMANKLLSIPGSIGYLDSTTADITNLQQVLIQNWEMNYVSVSSSDITILTAFPQADQDWSDVVIESVGLNGWPILGFSFFYLRKDLPGDGGNVALLNALVQYTLSDKGQSSLEAFGFDRLPQEVLAFGLNALQLVKVDETAPKFEFEFKYASRNGSSDYTISEFRGSYSENTCSCETVEHSMPTGIAASQTIEGYTALEVVSSNHQLLVVLAAILIAILSLGVSCFAMMKVHTMAKELKQLNVCNGKEVTIA